MTICSHKKMWQTIWIVKNVSSYKLTEGLPVFPACCDSRKTKKFLRFFATLCLWCVCVYADTFRHENLNRRKLRPGNIYACARVSANVCWVKTVRIISKPLNFLPIDVMSRLDIHIERRHTKRDVKDRLSMVIFWWNDRNWLVSPGVCVRGCKYIYNKEVWAASAWSFAVISSGVSFRDKKLGAARKLWPPCCSERCQRGLGKFRSFVCVHML